MDKTNENSDGREEDSAVGNKENIEVNKMQHNELRMKQGTNRVNERGKQKVVQDRGTNREPLMPLSSLTKRDELRDN